MSAERVAIEKNRYMRLVEAGICAQCGKVPARPDRTLCAACSEYQCRKNSERRALESPEAREERLARQREYNHERYALYASIGMCRYCGKRRALPGMKQCEQCHEKRRNRWHNIEHPKKLLARQALEAKWRGQGLCVRCGKPKDDDGHASCEACRAYMRVYDRTRRKGKTTR